MTAPNESRDCVRCGVLMHCPRKATVLCVDCRELLTKTERLVWAA